MDGEHGKAMDEEEERIESLKQQKAKDKSAFTRIKNKLLRAVCCKDQLRSCNIEKNDFPKLCQNKGLGELVLKIQVSGRLDFYIFFGNFFCILRSQQPKLTPKLGCLVPSRALADFGTRETSTSEVRKGSWEGSSGERAWQIPFSKWRQLIYSKNAESEEHAFVQQQSTRKYTKLF